MRQKSSAQKLPARARKGDAISSTVRDVQTKRELRATPNIESRKVYPGKRDEETKANVKKTPPTLHKYRLY